MPALFCGPLCIRITRLLIREHETSLRYNQVSDFIPRGRLLPVLLDFLEIRIRAKSSRRVNECSATTAASRFSAISLTRTGETGVLLMTRARLTRWDRIAERHADAAVSRGLSDSTAIYGACTGSSEGSYLQTSSYLRAKIESIKTSSREWSLEYDRLLLMQ